MYKLAITMGDPAGIGPEVTVRALGAMAESLRQEVVVVGNGAWLQKVAESVGGPAAGLVFRERKNFADAPGCSRNGCEIAVCNPLAGSVLQLPLGVDSAVSGEASFRYVESGIELVMSGNCRALATAPISKRSWHLAGHHYPGHTEFLRERSGSAAVGMMFWGERLKVLLATTHLPLKDVAAALTVKLIRDQVTMLYGFMRKTGIPGDIGLAALNPHAGEQGAFGDEEELILTPAVAGLRAMGVPVQGPVPADVLFYQALNGTYGAVVALYHDQGLVPFKMLYFSDGVNLSIGLPFFRTSADHGTAFDIAEKFIADSGSMRAAIKLALELSDAGPGRR